MEDKIDAKRAEGRPERSPMPILVRAVAAEEEQWVGICSPEVFGRRVDL